MLIRSWFFEELDFSFLSKSSWASVLSDCDVSGPGFFAFRSSEKTIQNWLEKACKQAGKVDVMGFSLGGVLAIYTTLFQNAFVDRCVAFNAPGVSKVIFDALEKLPSPPLFAFMQRREILCLASGEWFLKLLR